MQFTGDQELRARLLSINDKVLEKIFKSTIAIAQEVLSQTNPPVSTGELRDSGKVEILGGQVSVAFTASYALIVHERLDVSHPVGQAKFLEQPFNESKPRAQQAWQLALNEAIQ